MTTKVRSLSNFNNFSTKKDSIAAYNLDKQLEDLQHYDNYLNTAIEVEVLDNVQRYLVGKEKEEAAIQEENEEEKRLKEEMNNASETVKEEGERKQSEEMSRKETRKMLLGQYNEINDLKEELSSLETKVISKESKIKLNILRLEDLQKEFIKLRTAIDININGYFEEKRLLEQKLHDLRSDDCLQAELSKCIGNSVSEKVANIYEPILNQLQSENERKMEELKQNMKLKFEKLIETSSTEVGKAYQPQFNEIQDILHDKRMELGQLSATGEKIIQDINRMHRESSSRIGISPKQGLEDKITEYCIYKEHVKDLWDKIDEPLRERYLFMLQVEEYLPPSKALLRTYDRSVQDL